MGIKENIKDGFFGYTDTKPSHREEREFFPEEGGIFRVPEGIRVIGRLAFDEREDIRKVVLNDGLERIESLAFFGGALEEIVIPESVQRVDRRAFAFCTKLRRVFLNCHESALHPDAFYECEAVDEVICREAKPIDEQLHLVGKHFLEPHYDISGNLNHCGKLRFSELTERCARGDCDAMDDLADWFQKMSRRPFANRFYIRAANYWRYRAYKRGSKAAAAWFSEWFSKNTAKSLESILPENTNDSMDSWSFKISGKLLIDLGFPCFLSGKWYDIKQKEGDNIVEASYLNCIPVPGRDTEIMWTYLDDNMQPIREIEPWIDSIIAARENRHFHEMRELARRISQQRAVENSEILRRKDWNRYL